MSAALPKTATARGKIAPAKLAHCVLRTSFEQQKPMVEWYRAVLEAEPVYSNPTVCFMTYDDEHHRIAIASAPGVEPRSRTASGMDHLAFTYARLGELIHTYERLKAAGITPALPIHHGVTLSLYYEDPDTNRVELQIDVLDPREADAFMRSGAFEKNPIGVVFDPDELARRFHEGVLEGDLLARGDGPMPTLEQLGLG